MLDEKRTELYAAAKTYAAAETIDNARALCDAASKYGAERLAHFRGSQNKEGASVKVPFGRDKGKPLTESSKPNLEWLLERVRESLEDPQKAQYINSNKKMIAAVERELATR
jgi:hypothetical protein